jgi:hypothetical protein
MVQNTDLQNESSQSAKLKHRRSNGFMFHACTGVIAVPLPRERIQLNFYSEFASIEEERVDVGAEGAMISRGISTELVREHQVGLDLPMRVAHEMFQMLSKIFEPSNELKDNSNLVN